MTASCPAVNSFRGAACIAVWAILTTVSNVAAQQSAMQVVLDREGDTVQIQAEPERAVVILTSRSGIGRATITPGNQGFPRDIVLRLKYQGGRPFKTLEGFDMTSSRMQVRSSSGQSGKAPFFLAGDEGKFSNDDVNPSGWLKLEFKPHGDDLDVIFPSHLWRDEKKVHIQWIDFYRV